MSDDQFRRLKSAIIGKPFDFESQIGDTVPRAGSTRQLDFSAPMPRITPEPRPDKPINYGSRLPWHGGQQPPAMAQEQHDNEAGPIGAPPTGNRAYGQQAAQYGWRTLVAPNLETKQRGAIPSVGVDYDPTLGDRRPQGVSARWKFDW
jgi:hypothetical protein